MVNHKKLRRLYREERLQVRRRGGRKRAIGTRAPMALPRAGNERWSLDFASDTLARTAAAGSNPTTVNDASATWAVTTNQTGAKITGSIASALPAGVTLSVALAAPSGGSTVRARRRSAPRRWTSSPASPSWRWVASA